MRHRAAMLGRHTSAAVRLSELSRPGLPPAYRSVYALSPKAARRRAHAVLRHANKYAANAVAIAAEIVELHAHELSPEKANERRLWLTRIVQQQLVETVREDSPPNRAGRAKLHGCLGHLYQLQGEYQQALESYSRGLEAEPNSEPLRLDRGILLYGTSPQAIVDLEEAIKMEEPSAWAYFLLGHHYLLQREFARSLEHCYQAMVMGLGSQQILSELAEWTAMGQACVGEPDDTVLETLLDAIEFDKTNARAARALQALEAAGHSLPFDPSQVRAAELVRNSILAELDYPTPSSPISPARAE